jgi:hypothetical protein
MMVLRVWFLSLGIMHFRLVYIFPQISSFILISKILLCGHTMIYHHLFLLLMDIWVVSSLMNLWMKLLYTFAFKYLCAWLFFKALNSLAYEAAGMQIPKERNSFSCITYKRDLYVIMGKKTYVGKLSLRWEPLLPQGRWDYRQRLVGSVVMLPHGDIILSWGAVIHKYLLNKTPKKLASICCP